MSSRSRWIVVALAVAGLAFAAASAWVHYKLLTDPSYQSPCDMGASFNCSHVYMSPYGAVRGVPVALAGMFWFMLVALVAWASAPASGKAPSRINGATLYALSLIGLAVVLYLGLTSWFVLKTMCVLCIGTYVAVIGIFLTVMRSASVSLGQVPGRTADELGVLFRNNGLVALILALLAVTGYAAVKFPREGRLLQVASVGVEGLTQSAIDDFAAAWSRQPRVNVGVPADNGRVLIVKFNDFQCPPCGLSHNLYKPVFEKLERIYPGAVKYVLKDWPWNAKCNSTLQAGGGPDHAGACEAAAAERMAQDRGPAAVTSMREWLYSNQQTMSPETVKGAAEKLLGVTDFAGEYGRKLPGIREDVSLGAALRIRGTPTFFINGVRVDEILPAAYFELAIQLELNRK